MDNEQEYVKLLNLLYRVVEANKGPLTGPDDRFRYAEGLGTKLFLHAASVLYLSRETNISDFPSGALKFIDPASIGVVARAALETFLTFHYVFFEPKTADEQDFRYWAYKAAGLADRQRFPKDTQEHRQKLAKEKQELDDLRNKLRSTATFKGLSKGQPSKVLNGEWRLQSWHEIIQSAGLSKIVSNMYSYLCGYAHSGWLSILQIKQSIQNREQSLLIEASAKTIMIATANLINEYSQLFTKAKSALSAHPDAGLVEEWVEIGQRL